MNCDLSKRLGFALAVISGFILLVNLFAYMQMRFILEVDFSIANHIVPTLLGLIFGIILVYSHFAHCKARESLIYEKMAKTDWLTGAMSRYAFEMLFESEERRFQRTKIPFSVIMYDIDDFKVVNDRFGHPEGDRVLVKLTAQVQKVLRQSDTLCRWGGEEFVVLLPETESDEAAQVARRIHESLHACDFGRAESVTVSIGIVTASEKMFTMKPLIAEADRGLYLAKKSGKNRSVICGREQSPEYVI